jgi:hypothetical protein
MEWWGTMHVSKTAPLQSSGMSNVVPPGLARRGLDLPPGIAKKLQNGGELPPGIAQRFPAASAPTSDSGVTGTSTDAPAADGSSSDTSSINLLV